MRWSSIYTLGNFFSNVRARVAADCTSSSAKFISITTAHSWNNPSTLKCYEIQLSGYYQGFRTYDFPLYLFICSLLNNLVSSLNYTALNGRMKSEQWNGTYAEGSSYGLSWGTIPAFAWGVWGKSQKLQSGL